MSVTVRIPPFDTPMETWAKLGSGEKALLIGAQECDTYRSQEEPRGSNKGPRVSEYLRTAESLPGEPWCAAFVFWCCAKAGFRPEVRYPAAVASWLQWAQARGRFSESPKRGRVFLISGKGVSHMGFVVRDNGNGTFETVEGNTNDEGSREGYEVCRRTRKVAAVTGFVDLSGFRAV